MADSDVILGTLEAVAARVGDPTPHVYATLFRARPELERLFIMDRDGGVRGAMLQQSFDCIIDMVGPQIIARLTIEAARLHHDGYGVPSDVFDTFFPTIRDTFRTLLGPDWTPSMEREWALLLDEIAALA